jgi:hypothetical protein
MAKLPPIPFPGPLPDGRGVAFLGGTYVYQNGYLKNTQIDGETGRVVCTWRLYDYDAGRVITDQEAILLGVAPEATTEANVYFRAATDPFVAQVMGGVLATAVLSQVWPNLDAANAALSPAVDVLTAAADKLAADTTAGADQPTLDADNAAVANAQAIVDGINEQIGQIQATIAQLEGK